ncbi:MAG: hypothetical protein KKH72_08765 [Alphaproteobacteria bacterium]|nr:hypothetical protein [Alphaproteobacteria bacterium]
MTLAPFSAATRILLISTGLALSLAVAAPAQAADGARFGFSVGNGNSSFSFSLGNGGYIGRHFAPPPRPVCMSETQMRDTLNAQGYRWIVFGGEHHGWVHVNARRLGRSYGFEMNKCNGAIANLMPMGGPGFGNPPANGFGPGSFQGGFPGGFQGGFPGGFGAGPGGWR